MEGNALKFCFKGIFIFLMFTMEVQDVMEAQEECVMNITELLSF